MNGSPNGAMVPLWVAEPYRLWSLYDMLRFHAATLVAALSNLHLYKGQIPMLALSGPVSEGQWAELEGRIRETLNHLAEDCERMSLSASILSQITRTKNNLRLGGGTDVYNSVAITMLNEVGINIVNELCNQRFYSVRSDLVFLMGDAPLFGEQVDKVFKEAAKDIAASGRCLALDEWTASVFHCMRVLEHGLRGFAEYLEVPMSGKLEFENWKNIIDQIEAKIRSLEGMSKGREKSEKIRFCSEAASQFRYFKDAWRNHVAHSRASYDGREAFAIWEHTRDFMVTLAQRLAAETAQE